MLDAPIKRFFARTVKQGALTVVYASGETVTYGDGKGVPVTLRFCDWGAVRAFYLNPALRVGEMYMDGRIRVEEGTLSDYIALIKRNGFRRHMPLFSKLMVGVYFGIERLQNFWRAGSERRQVGHHYDLDARLYELFLDEDWQYTCAYFETWDETIEEAQLNKKRHVTAKLQAEEGHRVLEMGCGWGGLALYIAEMTGAHVTAVTLSSEQVDIAKRRTVARGLEDRAEFRLQNYRDVEGTFDRVISIGMLEHVGRGNYDIAFQKTAELLTDDGIAVFHAIGRPSPVLSQGPFNDKYIFPGGYVPSVAQVYPAIERAGLVVQDLEILPMHYAKTCRMWLDRFYENWDKAAELYDERFCRMWELYLAASESAFIHDRLMIFQFQISKPGVEGPFGREDIARRKANLRALEPDRMTKDVVTL
ncbi:MAG: cyclopropane-fatty-acyl-phospholipid synthase family protein [Pseudomonadota bacterium]